MTISHDVYTHLTGGDDVYTHLAGGHDVYGGLILQKVLTCGGQHLQKWPLMAMEVIINKTNNNG